MIPSGYWLAAESTGEFNLVSYCVVPGFEFKDFKCSEISIILRD